MSKIIDAPVRDDQGRELGTIRDIAVDPDRGRVAYAVMSSDAPGKGDRLYAVPWSSVQTVGEGSVQMDVSSDRFDAARGFDENNWPAMTDRTWASEIHGYYDARPYWEADSPLGAITPSQARDRGELRILRGSQLRGRPIANSQAQSFGSLEDLVVDAHSGRVAYPVISLGDSPGSTDRVALPWDQIRVQSGNALSTDLTQERLRDAPRYDAMKPPQADDVDFVNRLYRFYGSNSYWADQNPRNIRPRDELPRNQPPLENRRNDNRP